MIEPTEPGERDMMGRVQHYGRTWYGPRVWPVALWKYCPLMKLIGKVPHWLHSAPFYMGTILCAQYADGWIQFMSLQRDGTGGQPYFATFAWVNGPRYKRDLPDQGQRFWGVLRLERVPPPPPQFSLF